MRGIWVETLQLEIAECFGYRCVRLSGEGDRDGSRRLEEMLSKLVERGSTHLILDTRELRFLDPCSAETILQALERVGEEGGSLVIVDQSLPVERTLKLLDMERHIPVFPSLSQAAAYLDWHE